MTFLRNAQVPVLALLLAIAVSARAAQSDTSRLTALQERVKAMDAETAQVEAVVQIQRLGRAFGYYTDKGYFGEAADLFTEDGSFQWGNDGIYKGKARIRELLTRHGGGSMKEA
ncbi:MAG TPA: nuclear transport factor 2 family protein, partial [Steroidobacteraceae bacterium]|nr:nuclear transport factor 2 family protein [Steroidobacteraceae bacterium]